MNTGRPFAAARTCAYRSSCCHFASMPGSRFGRSPFIGKAVSGSEMVCL
jgi:hypothetical protein